MRSCTDLTLEAKKQKTKNKKQKNEQPMKHTLHKPKKKEQQQQRNCVRVILAAGLAGTRSKRRVVRV